MDYLSKVNSVCTESYNSWATSKSQATLMISMASLVQSMVSLQLGDLEDALVSSKNSVRLLSHDWSKLEAALTTAVSADTSTVSDASMDSVQLKSRASGPKFWMLASPLLRSLLHMSSVYAHVGMFQETVYYGEAALKIAESAESRLYTTQVNGWLASVYLRAGKLDKAGLLFGDIRAQIPDAPSSAKVRLAHHLADFYSEAGDSAAALEYFKLAEITAARLNQDEAAAAAVVEEKPKTVSRARSTKARAPIARTTSVKRTATAKTPAKDTSAPSPPQDVHQASLLAAIILSQAAACIRDKDYSTALSILERAKVLPKMVGSAYQEQVITAMSLIGHSMEQIISDPVFSVMQDSTISFPAVARATDKTATPDKDAVAPKSPVKRGRAATTSRKATKDSAVVSSPAFTEALLQAQDLLVQAHATAMTTSDSSMVRRISALLQNTIILLSATSAGKPKSAVLSALGTVAVDLAHNITWRREQKALCAASPRHDDPQEQAMAANRRMTVALTSDIASFQESYVENIPAKWSVMSISLSDNQHDLCITKFQAGHSPFILRLPLERANSRDADAEIFNFEHGKEELLEIIKLANESSHSARDFSIRGERNAWWAEREALDTRLKDLLVTIEGTWLGGFKGIFSQHERRPDLLARFQKNFQKMLDSSLPSRSGRGKKTAAPVTLDPRILDLFIGLGDATDLDCDFDEVLNDLLYFVVDILQFHGERNAYDEIDFDAMVVETYDALRGYHAALKNGAEREDGAHTVLVLDKALHAFPWESLPCMQDLAVSRVPSLAALRQLLAETTPATKKAPSPPGHYVSAQGGTYMLNPSADLKTTQAFFQPAFRTGLPSWTAIVGSEPSEEAFEAALSGSSEILLYFGHGSGAQYIRGKTIRKLAKCRPATFLMGCSSAALSEAGEFECYGPVWNYMMAGCPAVVGTLWDVTDKDIDRFAGRAFEEWGLFARGTFSQPNLDGDGRGHASLVEAVMMARGACKFRYLNAAAVVVYGIPVYVDA